MNIKAPSANKFATSLVVVSAVFLAAACTQQSNSRDGIDPKPDVQAPAVVADSFDMQLTGKQIGVSSSSPNSVTLEKSSLDKEFLLMGSLITQQPTPAFTGIKSHVIAFKEVEGKLYMLDANAGHQITQNLPMNLLLTEFPVTSETNSTITFDFNAGMAKIFTQGDWYAEDEGGKNYKYSLAHADVSSSYINAVRMSTKANTLMIEQVAQVELKAASDGDDSGGTGSLPVVVRYYLSPYAPDKNFNPSPSMMDGMKTFGYFEVSPQLNSDGSSYVRASKWDINAPVVYAISANTPADFRQPITDAVLYWNKFFGKTVMQVIQLTDKNLTAPDPDYNIIQWVENDSAGSAYADAQMDPRSGQILHAQIYLTSVFGSLGKVRAERDLRDFESNNGTSSGGSSSSSRVMIKGFEASPLCEYESGKALKTLAGSLSGQSLNQAQALKIAQDYVRETVAHEVGHTLGLRHNFAGSLAQNFAPSDRKSIYTAYLKSGHAADDIRTTSSIMDYELFEESTLMGDQISRNVGDLSYDRLAIRHLYFGDSPSSVPAFCTDSDVNKYQDCQPFDTGRSLIEASLWMVQNAYDMAAVNLVNTYVAAKVPISLAAQPVSPEKVSLNPLGAAISTMSPRFPMRRSLTEQGKLVAVRSGFPFVSSLNVLQVKSAEEDYIMKALPNGNLTSAFPLVADDFSSQSYTRFSALLDTDGYGKGTYNGKSYQFSDAEKAVMRTNAKLYFDRLQDLLIIDDLIAVSGSPLPKDPAATKSADDDDSDASALKASPVTADLSEAALKVITARIDKYVFSRGPNVTNTSVTIVTSDKANPEQLISVQLPQFTYPYKVRLAAAQLLAKSHSSSVDWATAERARYSEELTDMVISMLNGNSVDSLQDATLPRDAAQWLTENVAIINALKDTSN
jgi:hypothetical protein